MSNKGEYISYLPLALVRNLKADKACIATYIVGLCRNSKEGVAIISRPKLAEKFGVDERTIKRAVQELRKSGVIEYAEGDGRGHATTYKKGDKFDTLCEEERGTNFAIKGDKNDPPIITINNNTCPKGHNMCACAQKEDLFLKTVLGDTPKPPKNSRYPFGFWWLTFKPLDIYEAEKEKCEKVWQYLRKEKKEEAFAGIETSRILSPLQYLLQFKDTYECIGADEYYKRYQTDRERDGWKRIYIPSKKRTIYKRAKK